MSRRRVSVSAAEFVCSVDNTKCPVCAALTAVSAVIGSRISPTMSTSGSWRRNALSAEAKSKPIFGFTCTWLTPSMLISTGSSAVARLRSSAFRTLKPA